MKHNAFHIREGLVPSAFQCKSFGQMSRDHLFSDLERKNTNKLNLLVSIVLVFLFSTASQAQPFSFNSESLSSEKEAALEHLVKQDCGSCHGMTLQGGLGPALTEDALKNKPVPYLIDTILYGKEAQAMPPWKGLLTEQEVHWIVEQLKNGSMTK